MNALLIVALFALNTLLMPLFVELIKERSPRLAMRLVMLSVRLLPAAHRDRYLAEWTAELEEMDRQNLSQLIASIRILLGAPSVSRVLRVTDRRQSLAERLASNGTYDVFITYSHAADGRLSPALRNGLHHFARPWYRPRALRVFRDSPSLAASSSLWTAIEAALADSAYLILLASPQAASSPWVAREVEYWLRHKSPANLLIVLTGGEIVWDDNQSDFDWSRTTALPVSVRGIWADEPRWVDLRSLPTTDLSLRQPRFREAVAALAAPLHSRSMDELQGEDIRQRRRIIRIVSVTVTVLVGQTVLLILALAMLI